MAQKRLVNKKISINEDIASLDIKAQLLFTWMIPHADDLGLLPFSPRTIKALVVPMWDDTAEDIGIHLESIWKTGVIEVIEFNGDKFIHLKSFDENQTLKKDRQPQTILRLKLKDDAKESWNHLESIAKTFGIIKIPFGIQTVPEEKGNEGKLSEEKGNEDSGASLPEKSEKEEKSEKTDFPENPVSSKDPPPPQGNGPLADALKGKYNFTPPNTKAGGITKEWQDKALRYAKSLGIDLNYIPEGEKQNIRGRWFKVFRQAEEEHRKPANLERAYAYLADYEGNLEMLDKINYFFYIYENGLKGNALRGT